MLETVSEREVPGDEAGGLDDVGERWLDGLDELTERRHCCVWLGWVEEKSDDRGNSDF